MTEAGTHLEDELELSDELQEFLACMSAHLEWHRDSATLGLPRDLGAKARVEAMFGEQEVSHPSQALGQRGTGAAEIRPGEPPLEERGSPILVPASSEPSLETAQERRPPREVARPEGRLPIVDEKIARASLDDLRGLVRECTSCELHAGRKQTVFSRGTGSSRICFIGEGPGAEEDEQGEPFVGAAGQLLDRMIAAMGLGRDEVYVCNVVKCRPPNNRKPEPGEMAACSGFLRRQLELLNPEVIVALGGTAVTGLLGLTEGITRLRGTFRLYQGRIPVMPTFHPAYLLRTPGAKREVWADLKAVLQHVGRAVP